MNKLIFLLLLLYMVGSVQAATFTATWCPVPGAAWYMGCIETASNLADCVGKKIYTNQLSTDLTLADNATVWFRVAAVGYITVNGKVQALVSQYSNPVKITGGITPPIIVCGC